MKSVALAVLCVTTLALCSGCPLEDPQAACRLECFFDCQINSCMPTCDGERDICYGICEANHPDDAEAENTCKNACAAGHDVCMDTCENNCTDQCSDSADVNEACADGEWDDWWGGLESGS